MTMDRKQKKIKKRVEKLKKQKLLEQQRRDQGVTETQKSSGRLQLMVFFGVALAGAVFIIVMST
ncbi:MAG: hypothetical protein K9K67_06210 [Bacteriovoracaceae bacterium]|nr:hypothetical protein [Bacteriovoracaceae bacterium]